MVISVEKKFVSILTCDGEFLNVYVDNERNIPNIGEEYEGLLTKKGTISSNLFKYAAACLIFFMILSGGSAYAYYTPVSTIVVNINPSLEMKLNRWDRVIDVKPLNEDGVKLLKEINIKNDVVDKALMEILERSEKDKFINEDYTKENKIVTLNIEGKKDVDLSGFKKEIDKEKLNLRIDKNGTVIFNKTNSDKIIMLKIKR
ncbi:anti-sigma-I factor RsgI family protein [Clostridium carboxidivorans]|uniref:anti-sigma-I factor RsgI family protein n=1 Tax=Clostridium carboxidivorans TaxID=217159 RepID=UPI003BF87374